MNRILVAALLLAISLLAACAMSDTPENRAKEAARYLVALPPNSMVDEMVSNIAENAPPEQVDVFKNAVKASFDMKALETAMKDSLVKNFTVQELKFLADFYSSPTAKAAMKKYPEYMKEIMPVFQREMMKIMGTIKQGAGAPGQGQGGE